MKIFIFIIISSIYLVSCQKDTLTDKVPLKENDVELYQYGTKINFRSSTDSILLEFVNQNNLKKCYGQIYINKIYDDSIIITITSCQPYHHESPILKYNYAKPLFYVRVKDCIFDIFSGIEDEFKSNYNYPKYVNDTSKFIVWHLYDIGGKIKKANKQGIPFMEDPITNLPSPPPPPSD